METSKLPEKYNPVDLGKTSDMPIRNVANAVKQKIDEVEHKKIPTLPELQKKYEKTPVYEANKRFREEFFTVAQEVFFAQTVAHDYSLKFSVADDTEVPTACINTKTGAVQIGKSLALVCLDGQENHDAHYNLKTLKFILGHEIKHYCDEYNPGEEVEITFPKDLERYKTWLEKFNLYLHAKWEKEYGEFNGSKNENNDENNQVDKINTGTPLHYIYHNYFNKLDDCLVNEGALDALPELRKDFPLQDIYEQVLLTSTEYKKGETSLFDQLGYYLLQQVMSPNLKITVDPLVQAELDKTYSFNGTQRTLLDILNYLSYYNKTNYAAKRYVRQYSQYFIPAFERLLEIDKQDAEKMKKALEEAKKEFENNSKNKPKPENKPGDKPKPKPGQGNPNPFGQKIDDVNKSSEKAKGKSNQARKKANEANQAKNKTDAERAKDIAQKYASNFAKNNGLETDKTQKYFDIYNENREEITELADFMIALLTRNKTESYSIIERRKKSGKLINKDLINNYAGIYGGNQTSTNVFEKKITLEKLKPRIIRMMLRLVLDNSGSMSSLVGDLETFLIIVGHAIREANQKLIKDYNLDAKLESQIMIFGNTFDPSDKDSGGRVIKEPEKPDTNQEEFHAQMIKALSKITCNEGTDDSHAWQKINKELFKAEEVQAEGDTESFSIALEATDGFTVDPSATKPHLEAIKQKGVKTKCLFFPNDQALDVSLSDITANLQKDLWQAMQTKNDIEIRRLEQEIREKTRQYQIDNAHMLEKNDSKNIWGDDFNIVQKPKDIIPIIMSLMMEAVNDIDEKLTGEKTYSLEKYFVSE